MSSSSLRGQSFRERLHHRFKRIRGRTREISTDSVPSAPLEERMEPSISARSDVSCQTSLATVPCINTSDSLRKIQVSRHSLDLSNENINRVRDTHDKWSDDVSIKTTDLWSAALREAINTYEPKLDIARFEGKTIAQLFTDLDTIDKSCTEQSIFRRGLAHLQSVRGPLDNFKVALDLVHPFLSFDPTAATAVGIVKGVTAIAISLASADLEFARIVGDMLEQISYIDDCDTLGQKTDSERIHNALVLVYQKILEFYKVALEVISDSGSKMVLRLMLNNVRLPEIVEDFSKRTDALNRLVVNATQGILLEVRTMLYDQEIARWLGGEKLFHQHHRHAELRAVHADNTCEFLLQDHNFSKWCYQPDCRQLVIYGDMGCGKSVASGFLIEEMLRKSRQQVPHAKVCYCYCQDDGSGRAIHVFSTLILQLLKQFAGLTKAFYNWYKDKQASGHFEPAADAAMLAIFLEDILGSVDRPIFIIIDGLDECDRESREQILRLLNNASQKSARVKTMLLSRPSEEIIEQLSLAARIDFKTDTRRDAVIASHAVESQLSHLSADVRYLITETVSRRAQGSAIWTKMMINLIQVRRHRALGPISDLLEDASAPESLSSLYNTLLFRCSSGDLENYDIGSTALRLLAVARRPLSITELAWTVAMAISPPHVTTIAALSRLVDHHRVFECIHPFITQIDYSDLQKRQVGLVHQSVREFLQVHHASREQSRRRFFSADKSSNMPSHNSYAELLEASMLNVCLRYLALDEIGQNQLFSAHQMAIDELPQQVDLFEEQTEPAEYNPACSWEDWESDMIQYDPAERGFGGFFVYASCYWLGHYGQIDTISLVSLERVEKVCESGSTRLHNWIEQNRRPGCAIKPRFEFDSSLYDPLSITSLYGSETILVHLLQSADFGKKEYAPYSVVVAADQIQRWGEAARLQLLFRSRLGHQFDGHDVS